MFHEKSWPEGQTLLQEFGRESLQILTDHSLPVVIDADEVTAEWEVFKNSPVCNDSSIPIKSMEPCQVMTTLVETEYFSALFPTLCKLCLIALLIPASTADCERDFSSLKRIKIPLRNCLSNTIINQLLFISAEGPALGKFDFDAACNLWASKRNRRISVT